MAKQNTLGAALIGGAILAFWLYGLIFGYDDSMNVGTWALMGMLGLGIGACVYGLRFAQPTLRIVLSATIGMILVFLILGAIIEEVPELWAAFITGLGSSVIVSSLPLPQRSPA